MVTKLAIKPNSRGQYPATKRNWSVLTATDPRHVKRLEHIQETLDAAIEAIQEEDGIEDLEDFNNFVESFNKRPERINESGNQKAGISVDLVTEGKGDEVSGFVFYLTKDPSYRTSGVYIEQAREKKQADKLENILEQIDSLNERTDKIAARARQFQKRDNLQTPAGVIVNNTQSSVTPIGKKINELEHKLVTSRLQLKPFF